MGKADILANLGEGLYQARITYNTTLPAARKTALEARIPELEQQLPAAETARQTAEANVALTQIELNLLIEQLAAATPATEPAIRAAIVEKTAAARPLEDILTSARREVARLNLELAQITTEIARLDALLTTADNRSIWCADYSTGLSGQVDTFEINGEPGQILIAPTGSGESAALLTSVEAMTPAGWARNFALHPYWQKWRPTYRTGLILDISGDTATVSMDMVVSSYQNLPINQGTNLDNVPIQYMNCNGAAFEVGDGVIVRFGGQDWSDPVVIGFTEMPKPCGDYYTVGVVRDYRVGGGSVPWCPYVYSSDTSITRKFRFSYGVNEWPIVYIRKFPTGEIDAQSSYSSTDYSIQNSELYFALPDPGDLFYVHYTIPNYAHEVEFLGAPMFGGYFKPIIRYGHYAAIVINPECSSTAEASQLVNVFTHDLTGATFEFDGKTYEILGIRPEPDPYPGGLLAYMYYSFLLRKLVS